MPVDGGYTDRPDAPRILRVSPVAGYSDRLEVFLSLPDYRGSTPLEKVSVEVSSQDAGTHSLLTMHHFAKKPPTGFFDVAVPSDVGVDGVNGVFFSYKATPLNRAVWGVGFFISTKMISCQKAYSPIRLANSLTSE